MRPATLYFDLASPYAYLAVERAEAVLGPGVELEPILLGAIFRWRGSGSWAMTDERDARMADVERRAAAYGLPLAWPAVWPPDGLAPMRAATWAKQRGATRAFALAAFRRAFGRGEDATTPEALAAAAEEAGLPGAELPAAIAAQPIKDALRAATTAAWEAGVHGVPTTRVGDAVLYGDDRLEDAAALRRAP